jgi:hypothetical protein
MRLSAENKRCPISLRFDDLAQPPLDLAIDTPPTGC